MRLMALGRRNFLIPRAFYFFMGRCEKRQTRCMVYLACGISLPPHADYGKIDLSMG